MPIVSTPTNFTGELVTQTPFDVSFGSTFSNYISSIQFTDSSASVLVATDGNRFASITGYTGTGNVGTLVVDAISTNPRSVTTYAGTGVAGFVDGDGSNARFAYPTGIVGDSNGISYVVDSTNLMIRAIDSNKVVSRFAGTGGSGTVDGQRLVSAFRALFDIDIDSSGSLYVTDSNSVRTIANDTVSTLNPTNTATFSQAPVFPFSILYGIAVDPNRNIYVVDSNNNRIDRINSANNTITTILTGSGSTDGSLATPGNIALSSPYIVPGFSNISVIDASLSRLLSTASSGGISFNDIVRSPSGFWVSTAANAGSPIYYSLSDATFPSWTPAIIFGGPDNTLSFGNSVVTDNLGVYIATGQPSFGSSTSVLFSGDGVQWFPTSNTASIVSITGAAAYGAGRWFVTGIAGTNSIMYASNPAGVWTGVDGSALGEGQTIATDGNSNWIAAGDIDARISSNNGNTWVSLSALSSIFGTALNIKQIVYANNIWIAVGSNIIARSSNRTTWVDIPQNNIEDITSVAYNSNTNTWLARGLSFGTTVRYASSSNNGSSWSLAAALSETGSEPVRKLVPIGVTLNISGTVVGTARTTGPFAIRSDASGIVYFGDTSRKIRRISNSTVSTYAGTGVFGSTDGPLASATFGNIVDIRFDPSDGSMFVLENNPSRVRRIFNGMVTTYAGTGATASINGDAITEAAFANVQKFFVSPSNILVGESGCNQIRSVNPPVPSVRPSGSVPAGFTIVDTASFPITVVSRIESSTNNGDILQLYKYEPFSYGFQLRSGVASGDTLSFSRSSSELLQFLSPSVPARSVAFSSVAGPTSSASNALSLIIDDLSGTMIMETVSNTVYLNAGRFFPPAENTIYTFYRNEPIEPQRFQATIALSNPVSFPALPPGVSFSRVASNAFDLVGTPLLQQLSSNYRILATGLTNSAQVVSVPVNIGVLGERLLIDISGSSLVSSLVVGTDISSRIVTSRCPPYPTIASNVRYTWSPALPDGFVFTDGSGNVRSSGYIANDALSTLILRGAPTSNAIQTSISPYDVTLTATRLSSPPISNSNVFTFDFNEVIVFQTPSLTPLFVGANVQADANSNSFFAQTKFTPTSVPIVDIFSPDLRADLSLSFNYSTQRAFLTGVPESVGTNTFTIRAINTNSNAADISAQIMVVEDQVIFSIPTTDVCYNFINTRPLSSAKLGYYPYPIQFRANTLSGCNVTMTTNDLAGTSIVLSNISNNLYQLEGTPFSTKALTTLTVTATSSATNASNTATARYEIVSDEFTFNTPTLSFVENIPITPVQFVATSLSGRPILLYSSSNLPSGFQLTSTGILSGIPRVETNGTFDVQASTGYAFDTNTYSYTVIPDRVLLFTESPTYTVPTGSSAAIQIRSATSSGIALTSFDLSGLPQSYGVSIDSSGLISGVVSTSIPPSTPFTVLGYASTRLGTLAGTLSSANPFVSSTFSFTSPFAGGPIVTSPSQTSYILYQYMIIPPIAFTATGTGTVSFLLNKSELPLGLTWDPLTQKITGSPMRTGTTTVTVYAADNTGVRPILITFQVLIPRIVRKQDGAGAFTSLLRQYVEVNAAQNSRDSRVFPNQERNLGEFMAPEAPDVSSSVPCKKCL